MRIDLEQEIFTIESYFVNNENEWTYLLEACIQEFGTKFRI